MKPNRIPSKDRLVFKTFFKYDAFSSRENCADLITVTTPNRFNWVLTREMNNQEIKILVDEEKNVTGDEKPINRCI